MGPRLESWVSRGTTHATSHLPGVLLCSGVRLVSGSDSGRLRLWAVEAMLELRRKGSGAR